MIQALLSWAVDYWHVIESRVALLTIARVDGPCSVLDLDSRHFIALVEGIVREDAGRAGRLDSVYTPPAEASSPAVPADPRAARRAEIDRLSRVFGG